MTVAITTAKDSVAPTQRVGIVFIVLYALAFIGLWMAKRPLCDQKRRLLPWV